MSSVRRNSLKAWVLAMRPKTLTGAIAPVLAGGAIAWRMRFAQLFTDSRNLYVDNPNFDKYLQQALIMFIVPFAACLLFAILMQISANFINDYYDYCKGTDRADRLGPERACQQGWVSPGAMKCATVITLVLAAIVGSLLLLWYMQWELLAVGIACIVFCVLYTTYFSYRGMGDLLVLVFFGIVPVTFTCYVITHGMWNLPLLAVSVAMGLITDCLLMVNNHRDRHQDALSGKRTIVVRLVRTFGDEGGASASCIIYWALGIVAVVLASASLALLDCRAVVLMALPLILHISTAAKFNRMDGRELNGILGLTARNIFVFGLTVAAVAVI